MSKKMIWKTPTIFSFILLFLFLDCRCDEKHKDTVNEPDPEETFTEILDSAMIYLNSVCANDGVRKMIILKNGEIVFDGGNSDYVQNVWSCTKSFTSTVLGLLIDEGKCKLDDKVCDYVPELEENYPEVTFRHFSTMTSGYRAKGDEPQGTYVHGPSKTPFVPAANPLFAPGTEHKYWDSAMNMFALGLTKVAGEPIEEYFKRKVAGPIGMDASKWYWKDFGAVDGITVNGGAGNHARGIYISAKELAKFGQLFLNKGEWSEQQIITKGWIKEATSPQIKDIIAGDDTPYGYNWWTAGKFPDAPGGTFAALGFNNNKCIVIPEWDLVIVRLGLDGSIDNEKWNEFIKILGEAF